MSLVPGTRLGPFEIVAPLGNGGMGEVYRARATGPAGPAGASGVTRAAMTASPTVAAPLTAEGTREPCVRPFA